MSSEAINRWIIPGLAGAGMTGLGLALLLLTVRLPRISVPDAAAVAPSITFAPAKQNDHLFDLEPLFLPSDYNTSTIQLKRQPGREPGSIAATFPPKWTISESSGGVTFPEPFSPPSTLLGALQYGEPPNPWPEVGRGDVNVPTFKPRLAFLEVADAKTGQPVFSSEIPATEGVAVPSGDWTPLEFIVAVDSSGLVGPLVITGSTATEEVETFFRTFVARTFHLGARLAPGFYTVRIGP